MWYNALVEKLFFEPRYVGRLNASWAMHHEELYEDGAGNLICVALGLDSHGKLAQARYRVRGGPLTIATLELLCQRTEGCFLRNLLPVDYRSLVEELEAPALRYPAVVLAVSVFNRAIARLQAKERC